MPGDIIANPGGPLSVSAKNYVQRPEDKEAFDILVSGSAPICTVVAPINGGASSLLLRAYDRAAKIPNCLRRIVHLNEWVEQAERLTRLDLFRFLFRKLGAPNDLLERNVSDFFALKELFDDWARTQWVSYSRILIVVDGLQALFRNPTLRPDGLALVGWMGDLRHFATTGMAPYTNLVLLREYTGYTWSLAHASLDPSWKLELNKFDIKQVIEAFAQFGIGTDRYDAGKVLHLFHGHPYLTQLFADSMRKGSTYQDAWREALDLKGEYAGHWVRMKAEIELLNGERYRLGTVLGTTMVVLEHNDSGKPIRSQPDMESLFRLLPQRTREIWDKNSLHLRKFGLVDGPTAKPSMCEFYRNAIASEPMYQNDN
jgi:hypothetical protein